MGGAVKKVTSVFTGKSGGGETKSSTNSKQTQQQQSWLESNPQYQALQNNALAEANNFNMPAYQIAGSNQNTDEALAALAKGVDTTQYKNAYESMINKGQNAYTQGESVATDAYNRIKQMSNMSQQDLQNMYANEYNSDLVNQQIAGATSDIMDTYNTQVHGLNQRAVGSGAMGSSRAGVAQGVMAGQAQKAVGSASVQYRTAEEAAATQRVQSYMNMQSQYASQMMNYGQNQMSMGNQMYGAGMGYYSQYNQATTQNAQNRFQAGQYQRQMQQQQLDVNRQNQILANSPALQRLQMYNTQFLPMANLSTSGSGTNVGTGTNTTPSTGGNLLGGLMGMGGSMLGGMWGGSMGSQAGGMIGGAFGNSFG